jgi:hypothetical protein
MGVTPNVNTCTVATDYDSVVVSQVTDQATALQDIDQMAFGIALFWDVNG